MTKTGIAGMAPLVPGIDGEALRTIRRAGCPALEFGHSERMVFGEIFSK
jgi:hypothetical protein